MPAKSTPAMPSPTPQIRRLRRRAHHFPDTGAERGAELLVRKGTSREILRADPQTHLRGEPADPLGGVFTDDHRAEQLPRVCIGDELHQRPRLARLGSKMSGRREDREIRRARLLLQQPDGRDGWIGVDAARRFVSEKWDAAAERVLRRDARLRAGGISERAEAVHVADRVDAGRGGLEEIIDLDTALGVKPHARFVQPEAPDIRHPPRGEQHFVRENFLSVRQHPGDGKFSGSRAPDRARGFAESHVDAARGELLEQEFTGFAIHLGQKPVAFFDDRHFSAEHAVDAGKFAANVSAADDHEPIGRVRERHEPPRTADRALRPHLLGFIGLGAGGENDVRGLHRAFDRTGGMVLGDTNAAVAEQPRRAPEDAHAGGLQLVGQALGESDHFAPLVRDPIRKTRGFFVFAVGAAPQRAQLAGALHEAAHRDRAGVERATAEQMLFDQQHACAALCAEQGRFRAARTGADDREVVNRFIIHGGSFDRAAAGRSPRVGQRCASVAHPVATNGHHSTIRGERAAARTRSLGS
jgi:hypothetical protein